MNNNNAIFEIKKLLAISKKLALTSPTGGGRSVDIVRSRTKATEFSFSFIGFSEA